jgi:hypothetical protein
MAARAEDVESGVGRSLFPRGNDGMCNHIACERYRSEMESANRLYSVGDRKKEWRKLASLGRPEMGKTLARYYIMAPASLNVGEDAQ